MRDHTESSSLREADESNRALRHLDREARASSSSRTSYRTDESSPIEHTHTEATRLSTEALAYHAHKAANLSLSAALERLWADGSRTRDLTKRLSTRKSRERAQGREKLASSRVARRARLRRERSLGPMLARYRLRSPLAHHARRNRKDRRRRSRTMARATSSQSAYERSKKLHIDSACVATTALAPRESLSDPETSR